MLDPTDRQQSSVYNSIIEIAIVLHISLEDTLRQMLSLNWRLKQRISSHRQQIFNITIKIMSSPWIQL